MAIFIHPSCLTPRGEYEPTPEIASGALHDWLKRKGYFQTNITHTRKRPVCLEPGCHNTVSKSNCRCVLHANASRRAKARRKTTCNRCEQPRYKNNPYCRAHLNEYQRTLRAKKKGQSA